MGQSDSGLGAKARRVVCALLGLAQNRLKLISLELEAEKLRFLDRLVKLAVTLAFCLIAFLLGTLTLALYVWEVAGYAGLLLMTGVFLLAGAFLLWRLRESFRVETRPFEKTLAEFEKDRECLRRRDS